jgi:hypothetical protein
MMKTVLDEPVTQRNVDATADNRRRQDEEEVARRVDRAINNAKATVSEKLEDTKAATERILRHGRYAVEDGLSELVHTFKRHPIGFLGAAFAVGAAFGLLVSHSANKPEDACE